MKFRHLTIGHIEEPSKALQEQYINRPDIWEEVVEGADIEVKPTETGKDPSYKELKEIATEMGIEFKSNVTKADLMEMIQQAKDLVTE